MKNNTQEYWEDLSDEKLEGLHTRQLINLKNGITAIKTRYAMYAGPRCCNECHEYVGDDWDTEIKPVLDKHNEYLKRIKAVLATRPHIPNKQEAKALRKKKLNQKRNR